ncbi:MAG: DUF1015 domain-containing protein [Clostridiales bacterium]|nr:DUF1015 domain-containing protein [Clostridiales bacterium]
MANIKPFRGYMFNQNKIENLGSVMSPPYDSISPSEQKEFYNRHEYNAIRLAKGLRFDTDTDVDNPFTRAKAYWQDWIKNEILVRDEQPAIYLYEQEADYGHSSFTNKGFVALLELEDLGHNVVSCEDTTPINRKDRYELLSHTKANFNMINCMYIESEKYLSRMMTEISDTVPDVSFTVPDGTRERLWRITDPEKIDFIVKALAPHTLYIADGQNRYETSLAYRNECMKNNPNHTGKEPYNYIMTLLTNAYDDGIVQLPFHRLVRFNKPFNESFFVASCQDNFKVEKIIVDTDTSEFADTVKKQISTTSLENRIAMYCGDKYFYRLTLKNRALVKAAIPDKSDVYRSLDTSVLNNLILRDILGITEKDYDERIDYTKSVSDGVKRVLSRDFGCLLAVNPVKTWQIRAMAMAGDKMPPKSICVFPKPVTGVIMNSL